MVLDSNVLNHVKNAVDRLKAKFPEALSWDDLSAFVLSSHQTPESRRTVLEILRRHGEVNKEVYASTGLLKYRPSFGIASKDDLIKHLYQPSAALGIKASDISNVWATKEDDITELESKHMILVARNKKDGSARHIWLDDPTKYTKLDSDFRDIWASVQLPHPDQLRQELANVGFKAATEGFKPVMTQTLKKKRIGKRGTKITNTHMTDMLKDYSGQRQKAAR
jgi:transcription initiation factor TFIIE subunit beta